jgi:Fe-S-cluster-containing hydrogenase component 2
MSLKKTGVPTKEDLSKVLPSEERLARGACAILECFEEIPCDPCVEACPRGAITIGKNINSIPQINFETCNGCGLCISFCPGLAIFVIDKSKKEGLVTLPYEFIPLPQKGSIVDGLSREGEYICKAEVKRVLNRKEQDRTAIITISIPPEFVLDVRHIRVNPSL